VRDVLLDLISYNELAAIVGEHLCLQLRLAPTNEHPDIAPALTLALVHHEHIVRSLRDLELPFHYCTTFSEIDR